MPDNKPPGPAGIDHGSPEAVVTCDFMEPPGPLGLGGVEPEDWHPPMLPIWHPPMLPYTEAELDSAKEELEIFRSVYGAPLNKSGKKAYAEHSTAGWTYHTEEYLSDRDAFFGTCQAYAIAKSRARSELTADKEKLRGAIPPDTSVRPKRPNWKEAQVTFYAWTRRAYEVELGVGTDVPKLIRAKTSQKLRDAIKQVTQDYGAFNWGGFNPRPIKKSFKYRLGTLSDHALGTAIDINAGQNPQLEADQWAAIERYTGFSIGHSTRKSQWKATPQKLHTSIKDMSAKWVKNLKDAQKVQPGQTKAPSLADVVAADPDLKKLKLEFVRKWQNGFFTLPWALVKELHEEKFLWGATFDTVDLHHFEL